MMKLLLVLLALFLAVHCQWGEGDAAEEAGPAEEAVADDGGDWDGGYDYADESYASSGRGYTLAGGLFVSAVIAAIY